MSYQAQTYPAPYGSYQTPYSSYPSTQYPTQYGQGTFMAFQSTQLNSSPSPSDDVPEPPDQGAVDSTVASQVVSKIVSLELQNAGFDSADSDAFKRVELDLVAFVYRLFEKAHEYANLANRATPVAKDALLACQDCELATNELHAVAVDHNQRRLQDPENVVEPLLLLQPLPDLPPPEMLSSEDENLPPVIPVTLRSLPNSPTLPKLPPKHTYLRTPASPPRKAALPSLDKKLRNASLVQESLQHLLIATDDSSSQEDGELLGHIVNWEASTHPRKRWKINT